MFDRNETSIWHNRVMVPFLTIEMATLGVLIITSVLATALSSIYLNDGFVTNSANLDAVSVRTAWLVGAAVELGLGVFLLLLDLIVIILFLLRRLPPAFFLACQCFKTAVWLATLITTSLYLAASKSGLIIFLLSILITTAIGQLIYGAVVLLRVRHDTLDHEYSPASLETRYESARPEMRKHRPTIPSVGYEPYSMSGAMAPSPVVESYGQDPRIAPTYHSMHQSQSE